MARKVVLTVSRYSMKFTKVVIFSTSRSYRYVTQYVTSLKSLYAVRYDKHKWIRETSDEKYWITAIELDSKMASLVALRFPNYKILDVDKFNRLLQAENSEKTLLKS